MQNKVFYSVLVDYLVTMLTGQNKIWIQLDLPTRLPFFSDYFVNISINFFFSFSLHLLKEITKQETLILYQLIT